MNYLRVLFILLFLNSFLLAADEENASGNANEALQNSEVVTAEASGENNANNTTSQNGEVVTEDASGKDDATLEGSKQEEATIKPKEEINGVFVKGFEDEGKDPEVQKIINDSYNQNLDIKNPVFFISEDINSLNYKYTNNLCNVINIADKLINCIVYPVKDRNDIKNYIKRGSKADKYDQTGVNGEFILVRIDNLIAYSENKGILKDAPLLDVVSFFNGDYLFMFNHKSKNSFSLEQLIFNKGLNSVINVGYINPQSRSIFEGVLKPLFTKNRFTFTQLNGEAINNVICRPSNIDLVIFAGGNFPDSLKLVMNQCSSNLVPITLSSQTLKVIIEKYPVFSIANVISYYDNSSANNFLETYLRVEKSYKTQLLEQQNILQERKTAVERKKSTSNKIQKSRRDLNLKVTETKKTRAELNAIRMREEQQKKEQAQKTAKIREKAAAAEAAKNKAKEVVPEEVYQMEDLVFKEENLKALPGDQGSLDTKLYGVFPGIRTTLVANPKKQLYLSGSTEVKTFGMRYVLLASRYTRKDNVIRVFDALIKDYFSIRNNLLTPDMAKFSIQDIILGTGFGNTSYSYHYAIIDYPKVMLERKTARTNEENLAIKAILTGIKADNIVVHAGPSTPDSGELNYIYNRLRELNKRKQELMAIKVFQRDISNIQEALEAIKSGKKISDSVLESTGLYSTSSTVEDVSVMPPSLTLEDLK